MGLKVNTSYNVRNNKAFTYNRELKSSNGTNINFSSEYVPAYNMDLPQRLHKFNALKKIYTDKHEYDTALKSANSNGTYNPDAPQFIYANKKFMYGLFGLESITGEYSIVRQDGTINIDKYKEAMKCISGDMSINVAEMEFAYDSDGLKESEIKRLAEPLGIKVLNKTESEEEHQRNQQLNASNPRQNDDDYYFGDYDFAFN